MKTENIKIEERVVGGEKVYVGIDLVHNITVTANNKQAIITRLAESYRSALQNLHDNELV